MASCMHEFDYEKLCISHFTLGCFLYCCYLFIFQMHFSKPAEAVWKFGGQNREKGRSGDSKDKWKGLVFGGNVL